MPYGSRPRPGRPSLRRGEGEPLRNAVARRIRDARFPEVNTVDGFDFDFCVMADATTRFAPAGIQALARERLAVKPW